MDYATLIFATAVNDNIPETLSQLIVAQAAHETANFTSPVFKNANNAFGYKYVSGAKWQTGNYNGYAMYATVEDSTHEITDWLKRRVKDQRGGFTNDLNSITTPEIYAEELKKAGYYEDAETNYEGGVNYYFNLYYDKLKDFFRKTRQ